MKLNTIKSLREYYVNHGGFTGGWNVLLETFTEVQGFGPKLAVSKPVQTGSWLTKQFTGLAREVEIGGNMSIVVIDNWDTLVNRVKADALRERLLVMISGTLCENWEKAVRFSGRTDGLISRLKAKVPVGQPYWHPTEEQLASVS